MSRTNRSVAEKADPNFMRSLARGLTVLETFGRLGQNLSISQIAAETDLSRAVVSRCLFTLEHCGYILSSDHRYSTRPSVLGLAQAYLSDDSLSARSQPVLEELRDELGESCSLGVLDADDILYVARASVRRIMTIGLHVGSRLPALQTSMGRVLLSFEDSDQLAKRIGATPLERRTQYSLTDPAALIAEIETIRHQRYSLIDQELEIGLRSIAVPICNRSGQPLAAINIGASASRTQIEELTGPILEKLLAGARTIERML